MTGRKLERRKYDRFKTEVDIYFDFVYDLETKVEFALIDQDEGKVLSKKYSAVSKNVSVGGLCFASKKKVKQEDLLHLEIYLPGSKEPIHMKGGVEWCKPISSPAETSLEEDIQRTFEVGVKLLLVNGEPVIDSIHHDEAYDVDWSNVLESIFGSYRELMEGRFKK